MLAHTSGCFFDFSFAGCISHSINSIFCDLFSLKGKNNPELFHLYPIFVFSIVGKQLIIPHAAR